MRKLLILMLMFKIFEVNCPSENIDLSPNLSEQKRGIEEIKSLFFQSAKEADDSEECIKAFKNLFDEFEREICIIDQVSQIHLLSDFAYEAASQAAFSFFNHQIDLDSEVKKLKKDIENFELANDSLDFLTLKADLDLAIMFAANEIETNHIFVFLAKKKIYEEILVSSKDSNEIKDAYINFKLAETAYEIAHNFCGQKTNIYHKSAELAVSKEVEFYNASETVGVHQIFLCTKTQNDESEGRKSLIYHKLQILLEKITNNNENASKTIRDFFDYQINNTPIVIIANKKLEEASSHDPSKIYTANRNLTIARLFAADYIQKFQKAVIKCINNRLDNLNAFKKEEYDLFVTTFRCALLADIIYKIATDIVNEEQDRLNKLWISNIKSVCNVTR